MQDFMLKEKREKKETKNFLLLNKYAFGCFVV